MRSSYRLFVLGLLVASVNTAHAAFEDNFPTERTRVRAGKSSELNREDKTFALTVQPVGYSVMPIPSYGVNAAYFVNPDLLVQLELSTGKIDFSTKTSTESSAADLEARTAGVNAKYFMGNSFYLKGGAAYRQLGLKNLSYTSTSSTLSAAQRVSMSDVGTVDSLALEFAVGNQWQWSNFTLGCDWIGIMSPLTVLKIDDRIGGAKEISAASRKELQEAWTKLGKVTSVQLLRFYLGASF